MIRTTRAVLATAVPSAALALSVAFASAALAPGAAPAPESTGTAEPVAVATATSVPAPTSAPWPTAPDRSGRDSTAEDSAADSGAAAAHDASPGTGTAAAPAPEDPDRAPERVPVQQDTGGVEVGVAIDPPVGPGALSLTVAGAGTSLVESGSTPLHRRFRGALPTVTVADTRDAAGIPSGAGWYVLASATDFDGGSDRVPIGADHLGWRPALLGGAGPVAAGDAVAGVVDGGRGLTDAVLLRAVDGSAAATGASWAATAELRLGTDAAVAPGDYRSTLTLSLFE
ncbi:hypothetical protein [Rathayibacter sp. VKM Ac-2760]|uniref:hypothetical protein n=1 Tax=Rathayibacter sp. VKM Ac-2760 TaxID=2609253 RepID=UPI00131764F9|nr:hypothetical protein [Rathayibacter sp. VKM Ac-2760]QHC57978.1 hypothetical protein GSU72_04895 [Rathayibacter sp. VKM Ac-2760]